MNTESILKSARLKIHEGLRSAAILSRLCLSVFSLGEILQNVQVLCAAGAAGALRLFVLDKPEDEVFVLGAYPLGLVEFVLCELKPFFEVIHVFHS